VLRRVRETFGEVLGVTVIHNKADLVGGEAAAFEVGGVPVIRISVLTGEGLSLVVDHLKTFVGYVGEGHGTLSARTRHVDALKRARVAAALGQFIDTHALALGEITSDDLLGEIFKEFCIGK
jgi:tRNA modification GTPase